MSSSSLQHLCSVPPSLVSPAHIQHIPDQGNAADFNVAAWLHLPAMGQQIVSLILRYMDAGTMQEVVVDRGKVNAHNKILLSGIARLPVRCQIENMEVYLNANHLTDGLQIEELFVQAVEPSPKNTYLAFD